MLLENGATLQNVGLMTFVSYNFAKSRLTETLNVGAFGSR